MQHCKPLYCYFHDKYSPEFHSLVPPMGMIFTARTLYATFTDSNHTHFLHIQNLRGMFQPQNCFFVEPIPMWYTSLNTTALISSSEGPIIIYPFCPQKLHFLPPLHIFISHSSFSNTLLVMALMPYIERTLVKKKKIPKTKQKYLKFCYRIMEVD